MGSSNRGPLWIPYTISQLGAVKRQSLRGQQTRLPRLFRTSGIVPRQPAVRHHGPDIDHIQSLLKFGTEDNLMIGTDYSHTDISANLSALDEVRGWVDEGRISNAQAHKILESNSMAFYGL